MKRREYLAALAGLALVPWANAVAATSGLHVFGVLPEPGRVRRVYAAGAPASVLVYCLAPDKLLGWPYTLSEAARAFIAPAWRNLPHLGRLAGTGSSMPLEQLLAMKPDLIVDAGTVNDTYLSQAERVWRLTGIPYVLVDGRLPDSPRQLRETGALLGVPVRGEALARHAEAALADAAQARPARIERLYLARGPTGLDSAAAGAINAEVIEVAGGINVVKEGRGLVRVSREQLLAWSPDRILTLDAAFFEHAQSDAFWRGLPAVRAGRFHLLPDKPFGWLDFPPGVNRLIGLRWLVARLRGETGGAAWVAQAEEFHRLFYGYAPSREVLARLLEHA
ncbi:MAG: hypothetical protein ABT22_07845 [Thiobacillus sp. SCN 64-317]|nr:ABC transporter substrate-binding protein [Thiobacillus sp.]ODV12031.1 MAG: hypothetical protein ABT22_07845 [Thiobacillus sp. SCN 64-317]